MDKINIPGTILCFNQDNFHGLCNRVVEKDPGLRSILQAHGYPPVWTRSNTFATLIHIILEQQVSLASAKAAFNKLKQKTGRITAKKLLLLSDEEMRACYFSRQKMVYARHLAQTILEGKINLRNYVHQHEDDIRVQLKQVKGIGDWTTDVYLLFALQRTNIFPTGDLAMMNALKEVNRLSSMTTKEDILKMAERWQPYRSIATMLFWHYYIQTRNIRV